MIRILAVDPGTHESGWVIYSGGKVLSSGVCKNDAIISMIATTDAEFLAIEMIASYGMAVGKEVFETCVWVGRFWQAWDRKWELTLEMPAKLVYRKDVKLHLCGTPRAKDANIRQALIDLLGAPGTKKEPGGTYGVKSHAWAALAVAVTTEASMPRAA